MSRSFPRAPGLLPTRRPRGAAARLGGWGLACLLMFGPSAWAGWTLRLATDDGTASDALVVSNLALRVDAGTPLSPFVPAGPSRAEWSGAIVVDLRGDYQFRAEGEGEFSLEIQGTNVLARTAGSASATAWSRSVRLRKGTNLVHAVLHRRGTEAVGVRVEWRGRTLTARPLAGEVLQPLGDPAETERDARRRAGRDLYLALRCGRCHEHAAEGPSGVADALDLVGLAAERRPGWLSAWLLDPSAHRPGARMPRLLSGATAAKEAEAIVAYLESLAPPGGVPGTGSPLRAGDAATGQALFSSLACDACHGTGPVPVPEGGVGLAHVGGKYASGALAQFLAHPGARDPWTRMPRFALSEGEITHLSAWLESASTAVSPPTATGSGHTPAPDLVARGRRWVEQQGCANCHRLPGVAPITVRPLEASAAGALERGCLGEGDRAGRAPRFSLVAGQRDALRAFLASPVKRPVVPVPWDDARRWVQDLRCHACHEARDGVPTLRQAGGKLRADWTERLLAGAVAQPSRPWLTLRMPAWPAHAAGLSTGLAALDGHGRSGDEDAAPDPEAAAIGRKLVSASGGFACVTCHPIGKAAATAVFEAPGIPFQFVAERLRPQFAWRWIRDPQSVDPTTKMPMYFDEEGRSPLTEYYGGDGEKTVRALWEYLRLGPRMEPPP